MSTNNDNERLIGEFSAKIESLEREVNKLNQIVEVLRKQNDQQRWLIIGGLFAFVVTSGGNASIVSVIARLIGV